MKTPKNFLLLLLTGAIAGGINGFFGGGGGMIVVPMLISACGFLRKNAHASALLIMLPVCLISAVVYILNGDFDFSLVLPVTIGFSVGGGLGAFLLNKLNDKWIKIVFCLLVLSAGGKLLFF